jgi:hypothetical protein
MCSDVLEVKYTAVLDHDMISMFTFSLRISGVSFDSSSIKAGRKVPGPCTSGRRAAISDATATAEILMIQGSKPG